MTTLNQLNLVKASETLDDIKDNRSIKNIDILKEQRVYFNRMIDAISVLKDELTELKNVKTLVDEHQEKLVDLVEQVVPALTNKITRDVKLMEAKIMERIDELEKERLLENAHSRRRHIIANGVPIKKVPRDQAEPTEQIFRDFLVEKLNFRKADVDSMLFRDIHRLPSSKDSDGPPPIIAAFLCQKHRNDVLANAKKLKGTTFSLKSDLPKPLNVLRGKMLKTMHRLREANCNVRLVERSYPPVLQKKNPTTERWDTILEFNKKLPLQAALNPVLHDAHIPVVNVEEDEGLDEPAALQFRMD